MIAWIVSIGKNKIYEVGIELPTTKRNVLKIIGSIYDPIDQYRFGGSSFIQNLILKKFRY